MASTDLIAKLLKSRKGRTAAGLSLAGILSQAFPAVGNFIGNELLGLDDFERVGKYAGTGEFGKMLKSLGAGVFELGSTVIPGGALLKGAKAGKAVKAVAPIGGRVVSMVPGMTKAGMLTAGGARGLQGFRAAEITQLADALNSASQMLGAPSIPVGSARSNAQRAIREAQTRALLELLGG